MNPTVTYAFGRIGLLILTYALGYIAGVRGYPLLILAVLGSGLLSYFVLNQHLSRIGEKVLGIFTKMNDKIDENTRKEDVD